MYLISQSTDVFVFGSIVVLYTHPAVCHPLPVSAGIREARY